MGRSSGACLKIIACGRDNVDHEDLRSPERKTSSYQRGWSFRKKSARNRALSNAVDSEAASSVKKETWESIDVNSQMHSDRTIPEKTSVIQWKEEKTVLSAQPNSKLSNLMAAKEDDSGDDSILHESSIIVIQAAIRKFLAHRMLLKKKKIIKLQAVVRGYLVRQHAIGTLRCVQAIVKMQALVRARRARLLVERSDDSEKEIQSNDESNTIPTVLRSEREDKSDGTHTYISIEKLLRNGFARQLIESTPKSKSIKIKCDSSKSDSSWQWLERWMFVSAVSNAQARESESAAEQHEKENLRHSDCKGDLLVPSDCSPDTTNFKSDEEQHEKENLIHYSDCKGGVLVPSECFPCPTNSKSCEGVLNEESEDDDNSINCDGDNLDLQESKSISSSSNYPELQKIDKSDLSCDVIELATMEMKEVDSNLNVEGKTLLDKDEMANECEARDANKLSYELSETEVKMFSKNGTETAFVAPQIIFEEINSTPTAPKLDSPSSQDPEVEYNPDKVSITMDHPFRSQEIGPAENSISNTSAVQIDGSQYWAEIAIYSITVSSPDRSNVGVNEIEQAPKNLIIDSLRGEPSELETNGITSSIIETDLSHTNTNPLERDESVSSNTDECDKLVFVVDPPPLELEAVPSTTQLEQGFEVSNLVHKPSPDTSPRSQKTIRESEKTPLNQVCFKHKSSPDTSPRTHKTTTESEKTPSSKVHFKHKKSRGEKSESSHNIKSLPAGKKSPSNPNQDSTPITSLEQLPKEHKAEKRRKSFGSSKSDAADQEHKDNTSGSTLPNYMQSTESAKAKAIGSVSPRSSPDMQERDIYMKKRLSLPGTNGNQGSPHVKRSLSQAQQNAKENGTHSPQDRKWRR